MVHVPVTTEGLRQNGTTYETKAVVPVERTNIIKPSIALNTQEEERDGLIKQMVLDEIPENGVIFEHSEPRLARDAPNQPIWNHFRTF